ETLLRGYYAAAPAPGERPFPPPPPGRPSLGRRRASITGERPPTLTDMDDRMRRRHVELRRVVVTGLGVVSPNGVGKEAYRLANREGTSGVSRIDQFDTSALWSRVAATIRGLDLTRAMDPKQLKLVSRMVPLAILAAREALEDAGLPPEDLDVERRRQVGVMLGSGGGGIEVVEAMYGHYYRGAPE